MTCEPGKHSPREQEEGEGKWVEDRDTSEGGVEVPLDLCSFLPLCPGTEATEGAGKVG